jgi:hypothetical protein
MDRMTDEQRYEASAREIGRLSKEITALDHEIGKLQDYHFVREDDVSRREQLMRRRWQLQRQLNGLLPEYARLKLVCGRATYEAVE